MKNRDLISFFIRSYYQLPKQKFVIVILALVGIQFFVQFSSVQFFLSTKYPVDTYISLNILIVLVLAILTTSYFAVSLLLGNEEYKQLIYLPIKEKEIISAKLLSSIILPLAISLILQLMVFYFIMMRYSMVVGLRFIIMIPLLIIGVILIHCVLFAVLSYVRPYIRNYAVFVTINSFSILVLWLAIGFLVVRQIGFAEFGIESLRNHFSSVSNFVQFIQEFIMTLPFMDKITSIILNGNGVHLAIFVVILIVVIGLLFNLAKSLLGHTYKRNSLLESREEKISNTEDMTFNVSDYVFYLKRESLINRMYSYFQVQLYITFAFPIIAAVLFVFFKPFVMQYITLDIIQTHFFNFFSYALLFLTALNNQIGAAYSKEGSMYQSLKSMPFHKGKIYRAKVHYLLFWTTGAYVICYIIYIIGAGFDLRIIPMLIYIVLVSYLCYLLALIPDSRKPVVDWEKPSVAIKSNMNGLSGFVLAAIAMAIIAVIHIIGLVIGVSEHWIIFGLIALVGSLVFAVDRKLCK